MREYKNIGEHLVDHFLETDNTGENDRVIDEWIDVSDKNLKKYNQVKKIWIGAQRLAKLREFDAEKAWRRVDLNISSQKVRRQRMQNIAYAFAGMAASLILFFCLNFYTNYTNVFSFPQSEISMATNFGNRSEVTLPDGSVVKLNAGSSLQYKFNVTTKTREVNFSGEGFFNVSKSRNPFVITTADGLQVKVLGTKFNLQAYPKDNNIQTTLIEGRVELLSPTNKKLTLAPGQIATYGKNLNKLSYTPGEPSHMLSWMDNKLYLDNMSLKYVCIRLERWYDVQIRIKDTELAESIHYSGVLSEETIVDVMDALCELSKIQYKMEGKKIIITKK